MTLDDRLTNYYRKTVRVDGNTPNSRQEAKQAIYKDLMELIGDDFVVVTKYDEAINGVKKMQRTKLKEYCD